MALVAVATAGNEAEAVLLVAQLRGDGIRAIARDSGPRPLPQFGSSATHGVYVDERDEARARELLDAPPVGDDELARLAAQAGPPPVL
jgi:hypothetical protein